MRSLLNKLLALFGLGKLDSTPAPKPVEPEPIVLDKSEVIEMPATTPKPVVTGWVSELYESGGRGVATVSTGKGDNGGVSYGKHQLSSLSGSMGLFLKSVYGAPFAEFKGLVPGTEKFNTVYKSVCAKRGTEFAEAQAQYIRESHYDPQAAKLNAAGYGLDRRHQAVREMVFSTSVQYGKGTSVILNSPAVLNDTDEQLITKVQDFKKRTVATYFKSSSIAVQKSVEDRCAAEKATLLKFLKG